MAKAYKIHPAIGFARVGNSTNEFFLAPESPGGPPVEATGGNGEFQGYKDSSGKIRRQGARFRIFEYDDDGQGNLSNPQELSGATSSVEWRVELANGKGAANQFSDNDDDGVPLPSSPRNPGSTTADLTISPKFAPIAGANQNVKANPNGKFKGTDVYVGELLTDARGNLIVLGGRGESASVPAGSPISNFANNRNWHDDVADGPVSAVVKLADGTTAENVLPAWVIVAPPDFAPGILGLTTLYDIAFQAAVANGWLSPPGVPSFQNDILPILRRARDLRWVNQFAHWNSISDGWALLSSKTAPGSGSARDDVFALIMEAQNGGLLTGFSFTAIQNANLAAWQSLNFIDDFNPATPAPTAITPEGLDRAALEATVGGGFFPGIEAGIKLTYPEIYSEPFRLTRSSYSHSTWTEILAPGSLTARMAVPWQADFLKCASTWWPAQRPDNVITTTTQTTPQMNWMRGITSHTQLVRDYARLGFVVEKTNPAGDPVYVEADRDSSL